MLPECLSLPVIETYVKLRHQGVINRPGTKLLAWQIHSSRAELGVKGHTAGQSFPRHLGLPRAAAAAAAGLLKMTSLSERWHRSGSAPVRRQLRQAQGEALSRDRLELISQTFCFNTVLVNEKQVIKKT